MHKVVLTCRAVCVRAPLCTTGHGAFGKLGHGDTRDRTTPTLVTALVHDAVACVSLGSAYTGAVTREGAVYTWGASQPRVPHIPILPHPPTHTNPATSPTTQSCHIPHTPILPHPPHAHTNPASMYRNATKATFECRS
jgi:hypothetical protein